jgi:hypothetical protein
MVPFARNPRFVGRQQEIDYIENFIIHATGPKKVAIHGLGGYWENTNRSGAGLPY